MTSTIISLKGVYYKTMDGGILEMTDNRGKRGRETEAFASETLLSARVMPFVLTLFTTEQLIS